MKLTRPFALFLLVVTLCGIALPGSASVAQLPLAEHEAIYAALLERCKDRMDVDLDSVSKSMPVPLGNGEVDIVYQPMAGVVFVISYADGALASYSINVSKNMENGSSVFVSMATNFFLASGLQSNPIAITDILQALGTSLADTDVPDVRVAEYEQKNAMFNLIQTSDTVSFFAYPTK